MAFGRLPRAQAQQPMRDINVTPLVDVMLVLLVIFIITAPLLASSIRLDLPKTGAAKPSDAPDFISVAIDPSGQLYLNDQPTTAPALAEALRATAQKTPGAEVQLRADQAVPYGQVLAIVGQAQQAGLHRIGFVAQNPAAPAP